MNNPKISVIVPVYNVEKYLAECLDSIVNQTLKDIEIICLNDGSTDSSLAILKEYAEKDNRIKIIDKENEGLGYTRKAGLDNAKGEYILFCDSDDYYIELTAFEDLYNYIEKLKVDVVIFGFVENNDVSKKIDKIVESYPENVKFTYKNIDNLFDHRVNAWQKMYSKIFLDKYNDWYFPKKVFYEDLPFHCQVIVRAKISYLKTELYNYRIRNNSILRRTFTSNNIYDRLTVIKEVYNVVQDYCNNLAFLDYFYNFFYVKVQGYLIRDIGYINDILVVQKIIDTIKFFDTSNLFDIQNRDAYFYIRAGLRMNPKQYMDYLNKKLIKKLKEAKQTRDTRIKILNEQLQQKNEQLQQKNEQLQQKNEQLQQKNEQIKIKNEQIKNRDSAIKQKNSEIYNLSIKNKNLHNQTNFQNQAIKRLQNSWSYKIGRLFTYPLSIPLDFYRFIRDYNLIKKSSLFDSEYYLSQNEDVKNAKMNPIKHYLKFGWKEGRNPSSEFDANEYLNKRPDVRVAGICPLVHYIMFGKDEEFSFLLEKVKNLESENKTLENKNKKFENDNKNLEKKFNEKSVEFEQLNRKKSEVDIKIVESTKQIEKLSQKLTDLEKFKSDIQFIYNRGINKEKICYEIEKFSKIGITDEKREFELIVSLTSYPDRIYDIHYCIYSLLTQTLKPNKIILWLAKEQFPNKDKDLSKKLLEFTKYGLTIKYTKDIKQFKKLLPSLKEYPNALIVTADDDIFYPQDWLEKLYNCWKDNSFCIICHRAHKIKIENGHFVPYKKWEQAIISYKPSFYNFFTGAGGILYPPNSLYKDVLNPDIFKKLNPKSDDVWFWSMAVLNDKKIKIVEEEPFNNLVYVNSIREVGLNNDGALWFLFNKEEKNIQLENMLSYYPQIMEKLLED